MVPAPIRLRAFLARTARTHRSFPGRDRFLRVMDNILRSLCPAPIEAKVQGATFLLDSEDLVDFRLLYRGVHQSDLLRYILSRLQDTDAVFWDVGANVGSVALSVAAQRPNVRVFAFEPSPAVFGRLLENCRRNPNLAHRVDLRQEALSDVTGTAPFYASDEPFNSGVGGLGPSGNRVGAPVEVPVRRGDDLIASGAVQAPNFIKIDVEGYELEVLRGLERFLSGNPAVEIILEHEPYRLRERSLNRWSVVDYLGNLGFEIRRLDANDAAMTAPLTEATLEQTCELVARKSFASTGWPPQETVPSPGNAPAVQGARLIPDT